MNKSPKQEHLLVDGYNLIRSTPLFSQQERISLAAGRQSLQRALTAYAGQTSTRITLFFDGDKTVERAAKQQYGPLQIVFSRHPKSADDLIKEAAQEKHGAKNMRVITSDREIRNFVRRHKIPSTSALEFVEEMDAQPQRKTTVKNPAPSDGEIEDQTPLDEREIAEWERLFAEKRERDEA